MTASAMCDYCGKHENPSRMFRLKEPHSSTLYEKDFCDTKCLICYINREWSRTDKAEITKTTKIVKCPNCKSDDIRELQGSWLIHDVDEAFGCRNCMLVFGYAKEE